MPMVRFLNALALAAAIALAPPPAAAEPLPLTIVHVNDWARMEGRDGAGGAARIAAVRAPGRFSAETAAAILGGNALAFMKGGPPGLTPRQ